MGLFSRFVKGGRVGPTVAAAPSGLIPPKRPPAHRDSEDEEGMGICVPLASHLDGPVSSRRRAALDMAPIEARRCSTKDEEEGFHPRCSSDSSCSSSSTDIDSSYTDLVLIHRGRNAMVFRARERKSRNRVVLKLYANGMLNSQRREAVEREERLHKLLGQHPGIVHMSRSIHSNDGTYLAMEACNGGTLIEAIANAGGKLPERQTAVKVALPLLQALAALHASGIMHRHIRPEHLLIMHGCLKVGDLASGACFNSAAAVAASKAAAKAAAAAANLALLSSPAAFATAFATAPAVLVDGGDVSVDIQSTGSNVAAGAGAGKGVEDEEDTDESSVQEDACNYRIGSIEYMAPEMLSKPTSSEVFHLVLSQGMDERDLPVYDEKVDIWSVGTVLFEAVTGYQPFLADSAADMAALISSRLQAQDSRGVPEFIARHGLSRGLEDFLVSCFTLDPQERPSAVELLQHPWLAGVAKAQRSGEAAAAARDGVRRSISLAGAALESAAQTCMRSRTSRMVGTPTHSSHMVGLVP